MRGDGGGDGLDAADLSTFFRALFAGELVSAASLEEMTATGSDGYGLGLALIEGTRTDVYGHNGGIIGCLTHVAHAPDEDVTIVVGLNSDNPPPAYARLLRELLLEALAG